MAKIEMQKRFQPHLLRDGAVIRRHHLHQPSYRQESLLSHAFVFTPSPSSMAMSSTEDTPLLPRDEIGPKRRGPYRRVLFATLLLSTTFWFVRISRLVRTFFFTRAHICRSRRRPRFSTRIGYLTARNITRIPRIPRIQASETRAQ